MENLINLTPPIDGVQYGVISGIPTEWYYDEYMEKIMNTGGAEYAQANHVKLVIFSTNSKDQRFPYLQLPSKEQEVDKYELLATKQKYLLSSANEPCITCKDALDLMDKCFNANKGIYTQEQVEKALNLAAELTEKGEGWGILQILQSLSPTPKAVRVEREFKRDGEEWGMPILQEQIKVEQSPEYQQGIIKALEVIY